MERKKINIKDKDVAKTVDDIYTNALGIPLELKTAPAKGDVKSNTLAVQGTDLYLKAPSGKLIKITGVEIT